MPLLEPIGDGEPELLLLKRSPELAFAPDNWVFPGGALEDSDYEKSAVADMTDSDDAILPAVFNAAVRETREESSLVITPDNLSLYSHWVTPAGSARRFATWHCVVTLSRDHFEDTIIQVDGSEIVDHQWITASDALAACHSGNLKLMPPTYVSLLEIKHSGSIEGFYRLLESREPPRYVPKHVFPGSDSGVTAHRGQVFILYEEDVAYHHEDLSVEGEYHRMVVNNGQYSYINTLEN